ncbi:MAG: DUF1294 domain-containing protein [Bacteroidaceae bacterium]|nr:DUF1294 domain-containing protein [Bacteroidaceae bacterium]
MELTALQIGLLVALGGLAVINIVAFIAYWMDKRRAQKGYWRTPEATLLLLAFFGGAPGAWCAMRVFRHKTMHWKFRILVPLFTLLWVAGLGYAVWYVNWG